MSFYIRQKVPFNLYKIDILNSDTEQLRKISHDLGVGLNLTEMNTIQRHFSQIGRNPTDIEIQTIGQTWSEHCFHKTFKGDIKTNSGKIQSLFKTYIAKVTRELNPPWVLSAFEDNAGIVEFDEDFAIAVKVETHNHPSAIEPFGGAATGVGGVIRDVLGVWADPIACSDVLGFGPLNFEHEKLPPGVKHPKYVFRGVTAGIGAYGNNMGIPTVNGAIYFDETYVGNVVVYCGCVGLLPKDKFTKNTQPGDILLLVGGKTGLDGIHGVTFASAELTTKSEETSRPAVQIANPIEEEKVKRAIIEVRDNKLGSGITDLGGGGLSSAVGEMAHRYGCGAHIELEKVPLKHDGPAPWEIYISESQERMLLLIPPNNLKRVKEIFENEGVEATAIGKLTANHTLQIFYKDSEVANLSIDFLFSPPKTLKTAIWKAPTVEEPSFPEPKHLTPYLKRLLSSPSIRSREEIIRTYDHEVKGNTVIKPLISEFAGPSDAAVLKPLDHSWKGIVLSCGMNPQFGKIDPYWMAASSIDEAIRNNTAVGGRQISLLDNFVWGSPEKPDRLGSLVRTCKACYRFANEFEVPFISGKDSLYNESPMGPVTPTLLITAQGIIPDIRKAISLDLKTPGNSIYIVGQTFAELGGSEYYKLNGYLGSSIPKVRTQAKIIMDTIVEAIDKGLVSACHDLSEGGLGVALAEMAFSSNTGATIRLQDVPRDKSLSRNDVLLFSESNSRFIVEVPLGKVQSFETLAQAVPHASIGEVIKDTQLCIHGLNGKSAIDANLKELRNSWKVPFNGGERQ